MSSQEISLQISNTDSKDIVLDVFSGSQDPEQTTFSLNIISNIVYNPFNQLYYASTFAGTIVVFDKDNQIVHTSAVFTGLDSTFYVTLNPVNNAVYFSANNSIVKITPAFVTTQYIVAGSGISMGAVNPANGSVYFGDKVGNRIVKITTGNVVTTVSTGTDLVEFSLYFPAANRILFWHIFSNKIVVYNQLTDAIDSVITIAGIGTLQAGVLANNEVFIAADNFNPIQVVRLDALLNFTVFTEPTMTSSSPLSIAYNLAENLLYIYFIKPGLLFSVITMTPSGLFGSPLPMTPYNTSVIYQFAISYDPNSQACYVIKCDAVSHELYQYKNGVLAGKFLIDRPGINIFNSYIAPDGNLFIGYGGLGTIKIKAAPLLIIGFSSLARIAAEINTGAFLLESLKMISSNISQFSYPIGLKNYTLTGRTIYRNVFPVDQFSINTKQVVVEMTAEMLDHFIASVNSNIYITIKANTDVTILIKGQLVKYDRYLKAK